MRIGELSEATGVSTKTIRFWEQAGLLEAPARTASGYRDYPPSTERVLNFVRSAQAAGFTLAEIRGIFGVRAEGDPPCEHVTDLISHHLDDIRSRIREMQQLRRQLEELAAKAQQLRPEDCDAEAICRIITDS